MNAWELIDGDNTLLTHFDLNEESIVIDAGGYMGDWSAKIIEKYNPYITIYEPVKEFFDDISGRFATKLKITIIQEALWIKNGSIIIGVDDVSSGIYCDKNRTIVNCADVIEELNLFDHIDLVKMNIEGSEYELLKRIITNNAISKIDNILIQFHDFTEMHKKEILVIKQYLLRTHELIFSFPYIWEHWRIKK